MSLMKDLYIAEHERLTEELVAKGVPYHVAYDMSAGKAYDAMRDRLADRADIERKRMKGE